MAFTSRSMPALEKGIERDGQATKVPIPGPVSSVGNISLAQRLFILFFYILAINFPVGYCDFEHTTFLPMLIYAAPTQKPREIIPGRPRMTYRYAFPDWFDSHYLKVVKAVYRHHLIDTTQIIRATGYNERRTQKLLQVLRDKGYLVPMQRMIWHQADSRRRSLIWGLLPRGALVCSIDMGRPFDSIRVFNEHHPTPRYAEHAVDVASMCISLTQHAEPLGLIVDTWVDDVEWRKRKGIGFEAVDAQKGEMVSYRIEPDGLMILRNAAGAKRYLFVEADRANRTDWTKKIKTYKALYLSGAFHRIFGVSDLEVGFQVLVTTMSEARARHMRLETEAIGMRELAGLFHFATNFTAAETANVYTDPIWTQGGAGETRLVLCPDQTNPDVTKPILDVRGMTDGVKTLMAGYMPNPQYQLALELSP